MSQEKIPETSIPTVEVLTVGQLMEKLQFEDVNDRICIRVQNPEGIPPQESAICVAQPSGAWRDVFVWKPGR